MKFLIFALTLMSLNLYAQEEPVIPSPFKPAMIGGTFGFNGPYYSGADPTQAVTTGLFNEAIPFVSQYEEDFHDIEMSFRINAKGENSRTGNTYKSTSTVYDLDVNDFTLDGVNYVTTTQIKCINGEAVVSGSFEFDGDLDFYNNDSVTPTGEENDTHTPTTQTWITFNATKVTQQGKKTIASRTAILIKHFDQEFRIGHSEVQAICK